MFIYSILRKRIRGNPYNYFERQHNMKDNGAMYEQDYMKDDEGQPLWLNNYETKDDEGRMYACWWGNHYWNKYGKYASSREWYVVLKRIVLLSLFGYDGMVYLRNSGQKLSVPYLTQSSMLQHVVVKVCCGGSGSKILMPHFQQNNLWYSTKWSL